MGHHHHSVGVRLACFLDRDVFAQNEALVRKVNPDLVRHAGIGIVMECPAASRTMNEMAEGVIFVRPQPCDPACLTMLSSQPRVDPVVVVKRCDDDIANRGFALGMARFARKFEANLAELYRKRSIQDRLGRCALHIGFTACWVSLRPGPGVQSFGVWRG